MRQKEKKSLSDRIRYRHRYVGKTLMLLVLTVFQWTSFLPVVFSGETDGFFSALLLCIYVSFEWMYVTVMHFAMKKTNFELEFIAFFLSGIGLCLIASADGSKAMLKQMITVFIGVFLYDFLLWFIKDVNRVMKIRKYIGFIALPIFAAAFTISSTVLWFALSSATSLLRTKELMNFPLPSCSSAFLSSGWNTTMTAMIPTEMVLERMNRMVFSLSSVATAASAKITRIPLNSTHALVSLIQKISL